MHYERSFATLSDDELLRRLTELLKRTRRTEADLVAHIGEVDARRLYAREASPSMFAYCIEVLHLSEAEAYLRITAARAAREQPLLLDMLADGRLHLSGIGKLAPHLTPSNRDSLLQRATHRTKRQIEELIAEIAPRPDVPPVMRKLPTRTPERGPETREEPGSQLCPGLPAHQLRPDAVASRVTSGPPPVVQALAPSRYKVQFTASASLHEKLERLQALMPDGDLAAAIEQAVTEKLDRLEARRFGKAVAPRETGVDSSPDSRYIPAAIRRAVVDRDGRQCSYRDERGRRCSERHRLEYHHRAPYGMGGDRGVTNIALVCPAHNQYLADCDYGRGKMSRHRRSGESAAGPSATAH
jgi:hypothetical protein